MVQRASLDPRLQFHGDRLTLISQTGDYSGAIGLAAAKRFHIYEGGEGKLTKQHAKDLRTYYGVGSPSPMPFENDIEKQNLKNGNILLAFAYLGKNDLEKVDACIECAAALDPNDMFTG